MNGRKNTMQRGKFEYNQKTIFGIRTFKKSYIQMALSGGHVELRICSKISNSNDATKDTFLHLFFCFNITG
jgi:hypothetical protein